MQRHVLFRLRVAAVLSVCAMIRVQAQSTPDAVQPAQDQENTRIFGIIPNFRTTTFPSPYKPLTAGEKFKLATQDAFDRGTIALGLLFGGLNDLNGSNRAFGGGVAGYARYAGASYADFVIGDYMTEAIFPAMLHQDPRYFRRGEGSGFSRFGYAIGQVFRTHGDSGRSQFNYSELLGNASAVAISKAYYQDNRTAQDACSQLAVQLGVDAASNVLKEFWPDIKREFHREH